MNVTEYKAAGILPFAFCQSAACVLLGAELKKTGPGGKLYRTMWSDFGGGREAFDVDSQATASREFAEETLGIFDGCAVDESCVQRCHATMRAQLHTAGSSVRVEHQLKQGVYVMYITQTSFVDPLMFAMAINQNSQTGAVMGAEKTAFAWVPLQDLLAAVGEAASRYFLTVRSTSSGAGWPAGRGRLLRMQLHPCFASSLRLAQAAGLLDFVARAAPVPSRALQSAAAISDALPAADPVPPCKTPSHTTLPAQHVQELSSRHSTDPAPSGASTATAGDTAIRHPAAAAHSVPQKDSAASLPSSSLPVHPDRGKPAAVPPSSSEASTSSATEPIVQCTASAAAAAAAYATASEPRVTAAGCQKHKSARKGRRRGSGRIRKRGVTPDHMLYWLLHMRTEALDASLQEPLSQVHEMHALSEAHEQMNVAAQA
ncbi:hypothetical protein WJX74_006668 [Apatococcus lobatus]|uniref:Nudix hydrolase domain-containing protein n=1 Tax=Apatococcus lobatus TaxID=904363 RepID=A0AAW1QIZ1_9CHLO